MFRIQSVLSGMLLFLATTSMGCQLMNGVKFATLPEADAEHPVVEIICVWQPGEGTGMDGLPCRGFAGQILFFSMGEKLPVRINGKVRIYVFDDQGTEAEQEVPIHQFDFDASAFSNFLTNTNMGAAYQLFIPYTRKGTHNANCTLRVRYTPDEGNSVYSKMATIILPGTTSRKPEASIEESVTTGSREARVVAELLQTAAETHPDAGSQVIPAHVQEQVATENEDKRRLRNTLSAISGIQPAPAELSATTPAQPAAEVNKPTSFKLHPLATDNTRATSTEHPLLQEQPAPLPAKQSSPLAPAETEQAAEAATKTEQATAPAAQPAAPAKHPLLDEE